QFEQFFGLGHLLSCKYSTCPDIHPHKVLKNDITFASGTSRTGGTVVSFALLSLASWASTCSSVIFSNSNCASPSWWPGVNKAVLPASAQFRSEIFSMVNIRLAVCGKKG